MSLTLSQSAQTVSIDAKCDEPTLLGNVLDEIKQTFSQCWLFLTAPGCPRPLYATHSLIKATQCHYETQWLPLPGITLFISPQIFKISFSSLSLRFPHFFFFSLLPPVHSQLCGHSPGLYVVLQTHCRHTSSSLWFTSEFDFCFPAPLYFTSSALPQLYPSFLPFCWRFILWKSCNVTTGCLLLMVELYFYCFEVLCFHL